MSVINEKVTTSRMSAVTDNGKSLSSDNRNNIPENEPKINAESDLDDWQDYLQMISSPDYLYTI